MFSTTLTGVKYQISEDDETDSITEETICIEEIEQREKFKWAGIPFELPLSISLRGLANPETIVIHNAQKLDTFDIIFLPPITVNLIRKPISKKRVRNNICRAELIRLIYEETKKIYQDAEKSEEELTKQQAKKWFKEQRLGITYTPKLNRKPGTIIGLWNFELLVLEMIEIYKYKKNEIVTSIKVIPGFGT